MILKGAQQWYCVAMVCEGVLHAFPCEQAESLGFTCNFETVHLQTEFWNIMGFQYILNFCTVCKKVLICNENCYSSRDLRCAVEENETIIYKYDWHLNGFLASDIVVRI